MRPSLEPTDRRRWLAALLVLAFVVGAFAILATQGSGGRAARSAASRSDLSDLEARYGRAGFRIEASNAIEGGALSNRRSAESVGCLLTADTPEQQRTGLMRVEDLGPYEGMVFRYPFDTMTTFYMKNTPMPLSIAWFDATGAFVSSTDMDPCLGLPDCPLYQATGPYRTALEVPQGRLGPLGVGPGSRLVLTPSCD